MNKKTIRIIKKHFINFLLALLVLLLFYIPMGICGYIECHYTIKATVKGVYDTKIKVEDQRGHEWYFEGDGYEIGDKLKLKMFNGYTDNTLDDDEIINAKII